MARWAGGNNAGHTVWVDGEKYKTHLIPSGVFYGVTSVIGPGCILHPSSFEEEVSYLDKNGFDTTLIKVSPKCHIVTDSQIAYDKEHLAPRLGTTGRGIAPCYADKAARIGILAKDVLDPKYIWDEKLEGRLLCEGAQGVWLDIDHGLYPYVTSSITLPYGACSLGFPPQRVNAIWGAAKIYDTKSGEDPRFPSSLLEDKDLSVIAKMGEEFGVTTGRPRKVNWLNLDYLVKAVNLTGTTNLVISKCDILKEFGKFKLIHEGLIRSFSSLNIMCDFITEVINANCILIEDIVYSYSPKEV